jgi:PAS domain S-box-containing protein
MREVSNSPLTSNEPARLQFKFLPAFSAYILESKLKEFSLEHCRFMLSVNFPAFKYYNLSSYTEEEIVNGLVVSDAKFLEFAKNNTLDLQIKESVDQWLSDKLPVITREQVAVEDITLATYVIKKTFLKFIPGYTSDMEEALQLVKEIDDYVLETESASFHAFVTIQQEKINTINQLQKRHEEQLLEAQEIAGIGSFEWNLKKGQSYFTPQVFKIFEIEKTTNLTAFLEFVHPGDRIKVKVAIEKAMRGEDDFECEYRYIKNGKEKILWSRGVVNFEGKKAVNMKGTVMDITDRHYILQRLQRNEELYKQAQALAHIGNWVWNLRTEEITWSDELYRIFGLEPQLEEITLERFFSLIHPEDRDARKLELLKSLTTRITEDYTMRIIVPDGTIKVLQCKANILSDENEKPYKMVGTFQDITEEKKIKSELENSTNQLAELNRSLEQKNKELERSNKELTSFSYVASHDLQEPLRKIKTFSDLIVKNNFDELSAEGKEFFDRIMTSSMRMQRLIHDLLSFSRIQTDTNPPQPTDLNVLLTDIKKMYKDPIQEKSLSITFDKLPVINAVPFQLQQLFENIIGNSVKYSKHEGVILISIVSELVEGSELQGLGATHKSYHKITVADNGIGFEQKHSERIFEVFQRLHAKTEYSGTGIGLAICKKIAENHSGFIKARGRLNEGAVFDIYLPAETA